MIRRVLYTMLLTAIASCGSTKSTIVTATPESCLDGKVAGIAGNKTATPVKAPFWGELLSEACRQMDKENICLSPLSAQLAMSMIINGAEGDTKKEICETMQLGDDANARSRELLDNLDDKYCEVKIANSIWIKEAFDVKQEFINTNKVYFDALVERVKFNGETVERVNGWCKENTNGRIPSILDRFNESDRILLINALYFKAAWDKPFKEEDTTEKMFTTEKGEKIKVPTMMMRSNELFYKDEVLAITSKRLQFGYNMLFVLPNEGVKCDEVAEHLAKNLDTYLRNMTVYNLTLSLPKFTSEFGGSLKPLLEKLGIRKAFDRRAEFKGVSDEQLYISDIMQKTFIDVNEKGTEAAAVTAMMCGFFATRPPEAEILTFDRPFIYAIIKESNNEVMFTGKVGNPIMK